MVRAILLYNLLILLTLPSQLKAWTYVSSPLFLFKVRGASAGKIPHHRAYNSFCGA